MSTMIERVARAIYEKRNGHGCNPWSLRTKAHKAPYLDDARAAIEAMHEPTEAMLWAANDQMDFGPKQMLVAAFNAALEETP